MALVFRGSTFNIAVQYLSAFSYSCQHNANVNNTRQCHTKFSQTRISQQQTGPHHPSSRLELDKSWTSHPAQCQENAQTKYNLPKSKRKIQQSPHTTFGQEKRDGLYNAHWFTCL